MDDEKGKPRRAQAIPPEEDRESYPHEWVVLVGDRVVDHDPDLDELLKRDKHLEGILDYVEPDRIVLV